MSMERVGKWLLAGQLLKRGSRMMKPAITKTVRQEAHFFRGKIVRGMREQAPGGKPFLPLKPNTLRVRRAQGFRGKKALIRTGELRNAVTVVHVGDGAFVGILRTARASDGHSLYNVGDIHENGRGPFLVPITQKSRGFLMRAGVDPLPGSVAVITIPARPFIRPVFERFGRPADVKRRMMRRLAIALGRQYGRAT